MAIWDVADDVASVASEVDSDAAGGVMGFGVDGVIKLIDVIGIGFFFCNGLGQVLIVFRVALLDIGARHHDFSTHAL